MHSLSYRRSADFVLYLRIGYSALDLTRIRFRKYRLSRELCTSVVLSCLCSSLLFPSACQCNGHSTCINNNVCEQCKNLTTGRQCQDCMPGYYGDPTNGGQCTGKYFDFSVCLLTRRKWELRGLFWRIHLKIFLSIFSIFDWRLWEL